MSGARNRVRVAAWGLLAVLAGPAAHARPSLPWMPSISARHAIELLVDEGGLALPVSQWPLPADAVSDALDALPVDLSPPLAAARQQVRAELLRSGSSELDLDMADHAERLPGFGDGSTPGASAQLRSRAWRGDHLAFRVGMRIEAQPDRDQAGARLRFDDSAVATEAAGVQLQAWSHRSWWGPGWQNALALSNNAPALTGAGLQRAAATPSASRWLHWMGPWNAEAFIAQTEDVTEPANPYLVGFRLTLAPWNGVELGLTKMAQWGGRGREQSLHSFLDMLTGLHSNADTASQQAVDPANSLAGFSARVRCPSAWGCAVYGELEGEDQAGVMPSKYLGMYGIEHWSADGTQRWFLEYAETTCGAPLHRGPEAGCAYRNYAYPQGYVDARRWIGDSIGPDANVATLGWLDAPHARSVKLFYGGIGSRLGSYSALTHDPRFSGRLVGLAAQQEFALGSATLTPHVSWLRVDAAAGVRNELSAGVDVRVPLDRAFDAAFAADRATGTGNAPTPWLLDAALIGGAIALDHTFDEYAQQHGGEHAATTLRHVGNLIPVAAMGLAGLDWVLQPDSERGRTSFDAVEAGVAAAASAELLKYVVDRSRPQAGQGSADFGHAPRRESSFPSIHTAVAWAALTPIAEANDWPWLYGVAALTNAARVMGRAHWFSDTVAGALLGHALGQQFLPDDHGSSAARRASWIVGPGQVAYRRSFDLGG
jgi:hypothetical protein